MSTPEGNKDNPSSSLSMENDEPALSDLRVASLLPSTTDIVASLGLAKHLVGITHECDIPSDVVSNPPLLLTQSQIEIGNKSQFQIDEMVKGMKKKIKDDPNLQGCSIETVPDAVELGADPTSTTSLFSLLYTLNISSLAIANPTVVLTQDLRGRVCVPSSREVQMCLEKIESLALEHQKDIDEDGEADPQTKATESTVVVSSSPESLEQVSDTFVTIAEACGLGHRGRKLKDDFMNNLHSLRDTIKSAVSDSTTEPPTVLVLEWLDPPYDAGLWIPDMIRAAGCRIPANMPSASIISESSTDTTTSSGRKSQQISWGDIYEADPDVIVVACCMFDLMRNDLDDDDTGFDLQRNIEDTKKAASYFAKTRAGKNNRVFAADGNQYFARPGPKLLNGVAIIAQCAYSESETINNAIATKFHSFAPAEKIDWKRVKIVETDSDNEQGSGSDEEIIVVASATSIPPSKKNVQILEDIEDLVPAQEEQNVQKLSDFVAIHRAACKQGKQFYRDPKTGYKVYTELAHRERGECCGTGCRHCPYNHVNVRDDLKVNNIMQPAFLFEGPKTEGGIPGIMSCMDKNGDMSRCSSSSEVMVVFFSGGKDSLLALRAVIKEFRAQQEKEKLNIVLLTTFDANTRVTVKKIPMQVVLNQAKHLQIPLVGVPLHFGTSDRYVTRIQMSLELIHQTFSSNTAPEAKPDFINTNLVFGDLNLEYIRKWRDKELTSGLTVGSFELIYPLWKLPYSELLDDLEKSGVPCVVSTINFNNVPGAITLNADGVEESDQIKGDKVGIAVGQTFDRDLFKRLENNDYNMDAFGENDEFHTIAQVWDADRKTVLGFV